MPKITGLPPDSSIELTDLFPAISDGATKKVTFQTLLDFLTPQVIAADDGWIEDIHPVPSTTTYNGNRSFTNVYPSSVAAYGGTGTKKRFTRTVAGQTRCTDLESSSSQYFSKTSPAGTTFTDDFCGGAWIKLESYPAASLVMQALGRTDGTSGFMIWINEFGQVVINARNAGAVNFSRVTSYQGVPLNKWVYINGQLDMSAFTATTTTSYIMIDGVDVPAVVLRGGTNPTTLAQAGNLEIGRGDGSTFFFDGKIAQAWYSSAKITQANQRTLYGQGLTSSLISTHLIVSAYSFDNSLNDLNTTTANNLTAFNSAVATNVDSMFGNYLGGTEEYGVVMSLSADGLTEVVQLPEGCALPTSGGVSAVAYSNQDTPYKFPRGDNRWEIVVPYYASTSMTAGAITLLTWYAITGAVLNVPIGKHRVGYRVTLQAVKSAVAGAVGANITLSTASATESEKRLTSGAYVDQVVASGSFMTDRSREVPVEVTSATVMYLNGYATGAAMANNGMLLNAGHGGNYLYIIPAYV